MYHPGKVGMIRMTDDLYARIGERIRKARGDEPQAALAQYMGWSVAHVSRIEAGQRRVSLEDLQRIAQYFGKPLSYFVDDFDGLKLDKKFADIVTALRFSVVPVYGTVAAGEPVVVLDEALDVVAFPESLVGRADFGVIVRGDSMSGLGIHEGDILLVRRQDTAEDGEIVIARVNGGEYVVKRLRRPPGKPPYLESANPKYPPIAADKVEDLRIIGRVVGMLRTRFTDN